MPASAESDCIFCRIARGEIPCAKVYQDDLCLAFLDINPLAEGHLLLIPRAHARTIDEMDPDDVASMARLFPRLAAAVRAAVSAQGLNILQNNGPSSGQAVPHVHFHFIPRVPGDGLGYRWPAGAYPEGRMQQVLSKVVAEFKETGK